MGINEKLFNELLTKEDSKIQISDCYILEHILSKDYKGRPFLSFLWIYKNNELQLGHNFTYFFEARTYADFLKELDKILDIKQICFLKD